MATVRLMPEGRAFTATADATILQAAQEEGAPLAHACGGRGRCSTCRVLLLDGLERCTPRTRAEHAVEERLGFPPEIRLACQTSITGDVSARRLVLDDRDIDLTSLLIQSAETEQIGIEKKVAILFADIRSFTAFSESLLPYDVIHALNRYFRLMDEVVVRNKGCIDNYMGDGFLALFEGDTPHDTARSAVAAGLEMLEVVDRDVRPYLEELFGGGFDIRVGVHYGLVVAGTVGGRDSRKSTVIGDAVNVASRIEAANKSAGTRLLVSESVHALLRDEVSVGRVETVTIRGKTGEHELYEIVALGAPISR